MVPHDTGSEHDHSLEGSTNEADSGGGHDDTEAVVKGMMILTGIYFFFLMERLMEYCTEWKRKRQIKV